MTAIEIAMFKLKPDTSEDVFSAALAKTDLWLAGQPGFILRRHGTHEDEHLDYVEWESLAAAEAAGASFLTAPQTQAFMNTIDPASITMRHFVLVS